MTRSGWTARDRLLRGMAGAPMLALIMGGFATASSAQQPVDRFLASLGADATIDPEAARLIRSTWENCKDCDGAEFLIQGLAVLSPEFREGLDAYDSDEYARCAELMGELRSDRQTAGSQSNPFVTAHAAVYEIKALVAMDRLLEAGARVERLLADPSGGRAAIARHTYLAPEIAFLNGYCLLGDLRYDEVELALSRFLRDYPGASQRLVIAAQQMLAELANRQPGRLGEVVDLMGYAKRRLTHQSADDMVQTRQQRVIDILDRLIEEAEEQESSSSSSSSSSDGSQGGSPNPSNPNRPMQESHLPRGGVPQGPVQDARHANPGEVWGAMPPAERDRILQALRDSFPSRYRRLVEQYYEQLGKE